MSARQVKALIKLENEVKAYGNGMFLTVNYPCTVHSKGRSREEWRFKLVLRDEMFKREKFLFIETRLKSDAITKEFTMAQVAECRKYWLKMRDAKLPDPVWEEW